MRQRVNSRLLVRRRKLTGRIRPIVQEKLQRKGMKNASWVARQIKEGRQKKNRRNESYGKLQEACLRRMIKLRRV